ncbi:hypothetical protein NBO_424g0001 [Nosema bombycis CQ1]|uniref:Uncharacterized protein n=1 Tax=Nosema bombycis (strain CQ1 / CVCC 102059) TaxID=578461 RepID=R0MI73_NOSB1|nr:hypothetical protein NBO_424g0001 [Nosema bombycis CQ1]|eukprot:EOB12493.1 hypothetical protein NBO_424g0001 [Nosema bombycis CQ1]
MAHNTSNKTDNSRKLATKGDMGPRSTFDDHKDGKNDKRPVKKQDSYASSYCSFLKGENSKSKITKRCNFDVEDFGDRSNNIENYENRYYWTDNTKDGSSRNNKDFYISKASPLVNYNPNILEVEDASMDNTGLMGIVLILFLVCAIVACFIGGLIGLFRACIIRPNKEDEQEEKIMFSKDFEYKV